MGGVSKHYVLRAGDSTFLDRQILDKLKRSCTAMAGAYKSAPEVKAIKIAVDELLKKPIGWRPKLLSLWAFGKETFGVDRMTKSATLKEYRVRRGYSFKRPHLFKKIAGQVRYFTPTNPKPKLKVALTDDGPRLRLQEVVNRARAAMPNRRLEAVPMAVDEVAEATREWRFANIAPMPRWGNAEEVNPIPEAPPPLPQNIYWRGQARLANNAEVLFGGLANQAAPLPAQPRLDDNFVNNLIGLRADEEI